MCLAENPGALKLENPEFYPLSDAWRMLRCGNTGAKTLVITQRCANRRAFT
jgi:hypothetical protein